MWRGWAKPDQPDAYERHCHGKLAAQAQARRQVRAGSEALLIGRIFDDRGNRIDAGKRP
jgi:hypothetical protein